MKFIKKFLLFLVLLAALLAVIGLFLPNTAHVERSTTIGAPSCTVFATVNTFQTFNEWSPWHEVDPATKYTFSGPPIGPGARMSWTSQNPDVGNGSQEIVASKPCSLIRTKLDFGDEGTADAFFRLEPAGTATRVTWGFDTDFGYNLIGRYFGLFFDSMLGPDYEKGLANLKVFAEQLPKTDFTGLQAEIVTVEPMTIVYVTAASGKTDSEIEQAIAKAYQQVMQFMNERELIQTAPPITINTAMDDSGYVFDAAIPVNQAPDNPPAEDSPVKIGLSYDGKALKFIHRGPYDELPATYEKIMAYIAAHGFEVAGRSWDQYLNDPMTVPPAELITHIYFPVDIDFE
ncbi:MAG: GyrI-like domain-containing protein [Acidobacteria bacterium]|nr:GyrI-like domain-containing protein [Acidobacteriota bacterium]